MDKRWFALFALLGIASALVGCRVGTPQAAKPVALVNGVALTEQDLTLEMNHTKAFYREQYGINLDDPTNAELLTQASQDALQRVMDQELIRQLAEGTFPPPPAGQSPTPVVTVTDAEVQTLAQQYEAQAGSREELLAVNGFSSYDEFLDFVRGNIQVEKLAQIYGLADQVRARHILVATEAEAQQVLARLQSGEDFAAVAQEVSLDTGSGQQGGDLGWFGRGMMVQPFEEACFTLELNQVSQPVQTQFGYHIIQVTEKGQQADAQAFQSWFEMVRAQATIWQYLFSVATGLASELNAGRIPADLQAQFRENGRELTAAAQVQVEQSGNKWAIDDAGTRYVVQNENQALDVYLEVK